MNCSELELCTTFSRKILIARAVLIASNTQKTPEFLRAGAQLTDITLSQAGETLRRKFVRPPARRAPAARCQGRSPPRWPPCMRSPPRRPPSCLARHRDHDGPQPTAAPTRPAGARRRGVGSGCAPAATLAPGGSSSVNRPKAGDGWKTRVEPPSIGEHASGRNVTFRAVSVEH